MENTDELACLLDRIKTNAILDESRQYKCAFVIQDSIQKTADLWKDVSCVLAEDVNKTVEDQDKQQDIQEVCKVIADKVHNIADSLPSYGATVDVYLWPFKDRSERDDDSYIHYLGSLRRLKDWHNAKFTILEHEPTAETEFLQRFLSASVYVNVDQVLLEEASSLWRGKVSICNKIENLGMTIPGVCLHKIGNKTTSFRFPLATSTVHNKKQTFQEGQVGRMLEVLDEINLSSLSALLKTPYRYRISLYQKHPYSQVLLGYIQENDNTGLLARLPIYPGDTEPVTCGETNLSTTVWKENIMTDLQFVQEPEEDLQDNYEFLYFIITSPDKNSSMENQVAIAYQLQHPYQCNGSLLTTIYHKALTPGDGDGDVDSSPIDLDDLPVMSCDTLRELDMDLSLLRKEMLQNWINEKQSRGESTEVPVDVLLAKVRDIHVNYLNKMAAKLPKFSKGSSKLRIDLQKHITELSEKSYDWPERLIQQYEESQKRSLSRLQSSESVAMSSPLQPCETSSTVDIQSFLNFFHPDGSASNESLSPVRRRHPSRAHRKMVHPDTGCPNIMSWPESKETLSHDIYYNVDRKSEKINNHMNKIQEKFVKEETYSSCLSPIILFPKCDKNKSRKRPNTQDVRKSPRKKSSRTFYDENLPERKQRIKLTRLSDSVTPLATVPEKTSRRYSTSQAQPTQGHMTQDGHQKEYSKRRRSEIVPMKSGTDQPVPKTVEHLRASSTSTPDAERLMKESRSERHKRRLQDIVDTVLIEHGVERTDSIFKPSSARLFKVTKLFVMDLPNSRNLKDEMRKIAQSQVQHVIDADRSRLKSK